MGKRNLDLPVINLEDFTGRILYPFGHLSSDDLCSVKGHIKQLYDAGFSVSDAITCVSVSEEVNPDIDEDVALKINHKIWEKYRKPEPELDKLKLELEPELDKLKPELCSSNQGVRLMNIPELFFRVAELSGEEKMAELIEGARIQHSGKWYTVGTVLRGGVKRIVLLDEKGVDYDFSNPEDATAVEWVDSCEGMPTTDTLVIPTDGAYVLVGHTDGKVVGSVNLKKGEVIGAIPESKSLAVGDKASVVDTLGASVTKAPDLGQKTTEMKPPWLK